MSANNNNAISPVDVMAVLHRHAALAEEVASPDQIAEARGVLAAVAELIEAQRGCRDMLRESAKQFRLSGDAGHARHCDVLADKADAALARVLEQTK